MRSSLPPVFYEKGVTIVAYALLRAAPTLVSSLVAPLLGYLLFPKLNGIVMSNWI
jgi:hypothetical protein